MEVVTVQGNKPICMGRREGFYTGGETRRNKKVLASQEFAQSPLMAGRHSAAPASIVFMYWRFCVCTALRVISIAVPGSLEYA